jgi:hypothetical protein
VGHPHHLSSQWRTQEIIEAWERRKATIFFLKKKYKHHMDPAGDGNDTLDAVLLVTEASNTLGWVVSFLFDYGDRMSCGWG